jgi:hypothetical protein
VREQTPFVTAGADAVLADPLGVRWFDDETERSTGELAITPVPAAWHVLRPGCLADAIEALDDRGAALLPALLPYATMT